ncbi:MAG: sulfurtransferase complex subunit TusC [Halieaceae bacterium]|nr:sulfurtransferase complex subunit TusC [Halieaceae bacterium]
MSETSVLVILRSPPYHAGRSKSGLDLAMAFAAFDIPVALLFMGDGVWQLSPGQAASEIGAKSVEKTLASLPLYDIEQWYVDAAALAARGLDGIALPEHASRVDDETLPTLLGRFSQVLVF